MIVTSLVMVVLLGLALSKMALSVKARTDLLQTCTTPENRTDRIWDRIDAVFLFAIGQRRMFKDFIPGLMHALIFWGFLILLIRSISLIGAAFTSDMSWSLFFFSDTLSHIYTLLKDITEVWVAVMVLFAFYRRWVIKPERIHQSKEAELILLLIFSLMITDFLMDGAFFQGAAQNPHIAAEMHYAPIGGLVARFYAAMGMTYGTASIVVFHVFYWAHIGILLYFMNLLPFSKHAHVLTAIPNVFLRNLKKGYPLKPLLDIEEQFEKEEPQIGIAKLEDLSWKQALDLYTCTECGRCSVNCPANLTGKPLNPREFTESLRTHLYTEAERMIRNKKKVDEWEKAVKATPEGEDPPDKPELEPLNEEINIIDEAGYEVIWSCTTCRSCEENCPVMIEYVDKIVGLRQHMAMMESRFPPELNNVFRNLENKSNPWGLPMGDRADWCEGLDVPIMGELDDDQRAELDYLFFVGCAGSFDARAQKVAKSIVKILRAADLKFAILGTEEGCTGDTARRLGNEYLFQTQAAANIELFNGYGVKKILVMCPHCLQTIGNEYPDFGGSYEVVHHAQLIAQLVNDGTIKMANEFGKQRWVFHDSCYLGRYNDIYDEPRDILNAARGPKVVEIERSQENGMCCGAGGGWMWMEENTGDRMNNLRAEQLLEAKPDRIAAACPFCLTMIADGVASKDMDEKVKTMDIAEIVAEAMDVELPKT